MQQPGTLPRSIDDRAATAVVGLVLVTGLVVAGAGVVYVTGMDAKASMQAASEVSAAETTLQDAGATFAAVAHAGGGTTATVDLESVDDGDVDVARDGQLHVRLNGKAACSATVPLGTLAYEHDAGTTVAYQATGVFKRTASGTSVVQSPQLEYETREFDGTAIRTLSFPVTNVTGSIDDTDAAVATVDERGGVGIRDDLCLTAARSDELEYVREVTLTVEDTPYYEAWHRVFEREFGIVGEYELDHDAQSASVTAPLGAGVQPQQFLVEDVRIYGAIYSTAASGDLLLQTKHATVDSYDANDGPWVDGEPAYGDDGNVLTRGLVAVQASGANVAGNVYAEGGANLSQSCGSGDDYCVNGDVYVNNSTASGPTTALWPEDNEERAERISGDWGNGTRLPAIPSMDATIERSLDVVETFNTNDDAAVVDANQIQYAGSSTTVESGVYHLDDLTVPAGHTLTFDTTDGDVVLAIEGDVEVGADATVRVRGDGRVHAYVNESPTAAGTGTQLFVGEGATVKTVESGVETYRSEAFVLACKAECSATFEDAPSSDPTRFTGVLYAPGTSVDDGTVSLGKRVDVWGALVAGSVTFEQQSSFHFDTSLRNRDADRDGDGVPDSLGTGGLAIVEHGPENGYVVTITTTDVNVTSDRAHVAPLNPALATATADDMGGSTSPSALAARVASAR